MRHPCVFFIGLLAVCLAGSSAQAASDRGAEFTAALLKNKWYDTALDYLKWAETSPVTSQEFKQRIPYERARTNADQARATTNPRQREQRLQAAAASFSKLAGAQPDASYAADAYREAAALHAGLARAASSEAERLPEQAAVQKKQLFATAREQFDKASQAAEQVVAIAGKRLKALPKASAALADPQVKKQREELDNQQVEARFWLATFLFDRALTYPAKSSEAKQNFQDANQAFDKIFEDYDERLVGYASRLYQGRCYQEVGDYAKALGCYEDIVVLHSTLPRFRRLMARAHRRRVECFVAQEKYDEAVQQAKHWLQNSQSDERNRPEWLGVASSLADALLAQAKAAPASDAKKLRSEARLVLRDVSQHPSEFQRAARLKLVSMTHQGEDSAEFKTFADAFAAGKAAIELMNSAQLAARLAKENNPSAVAELQHSADDQAAIALQAFQASLDLVGGETSIKDLNAARYYLCWLYWENKQLYESAVLGQFIAERYPQSQYQSAASKVALAAYEMLYNKANDAGGGAYEAEQLASLAESIARRAPESSEASAAVSLLIKIAIRDDHIQEAEKLIKRLPADNRGAAELALGAALWTQFQQTSANLEGQPSPEALSLRDRASDLLAKGFQAKQRQGSLSGVEAAGILYLAQLRLAAGDAQQAVDILEDDKAGPLTLAKSGASAVKQPQFLEQIYETALRAYLSVQPPQRDKAQKMMEAMEKSSGADSSRLTQVYLRLGLQLQRQIKELNAAGETAQANSVAAAFEDVLKRVSQRKDAEGWTIRNWIAQTNLQLGERLTGEQAQTYLQRAKQAYEAILLKSQQDKKYAPSAGSLLAVRKRLADCERALGNYQEALDQYAAILKQKPSLLELQKAAAETLQLQGAAEKQPDKLDQAIRGALPVAGKNLVWGWLKLAAVAQQAQRRAAAAGDEAQASSGKLSRAAKYESLFFEARYNIVKARYLSAIVGPPVDRDKQLRSAKKNIQSMKNLYPDLGGPQWKAAFEELLKQIEAN